MGKGSLRRGVSVDGGSAGRRWLACLRVLRPAVIARAEALSNTSDEPARLSYTAGSGLRHTSIGRSSRKLIGVVGTVFVKNLFLEMEINFLN